MRKAAAQGEEETMASKEIQFSGHSPQVSGNHEVDTAPLRRRAPLAFRPSSGLAIGLASIAGIGVFLPVFRERLQDYFTLTTSQYGLLLNCGFLAGVLGTLLGGASLARFGELRIMRICFAGCAAGLLLSAWPGSWLLFLAGLSLSAFFLAPLGIALQAYLTALYPNRRRKIVALNLVAVAVCGMLFPLLAEFLLSLTRPGNHKDFAWILHGLFATTGIIILAGIVAGTRRTDGGTPGGPSAETRAPDATLSRGAVALLVALLALHSTADNVLALWIPLVLASRSFIAQPFLPGAVLAAVSLAYVVSRLLLSLLPEDRWRRRMMILPGLLGGSLALAGILSRDQAWTAIGYVAGAFCWSVECPVFIAFLAGAGSRFGKALAAFNVISLLAIFCLGTSLGILGDRLGEERIWRILLVPAAIFPLIGLGGFWWVLRYGKHLGLEQAGGSRAEGTDVK